MPLIRCGDCGGQISDLARACPKCGWPLSAWRDRSKDHAITTQRTARRLKLQLAISGLVMCLGILLCVVAACTADGDPRAGILLLSAGGIWLALTKTQVWWYHG